MWYILFVTEDLYWFREAELKHSRIAMLAFLGLVAQEAGVVFPGNVRNLILFCILPKH